MSLWDFQGLGCKVHGVGFRVFGVLECTVCGVFRTPNPIPLYSLNPKPIQAGYNR